MQVEKILGLIAGKGELPLAIAGAAREKGYRVVAIGLEPLADKDLSYAADKVHWISVGKLGAIIDALKKEGVKEAVMAGKVPKSLIYENRIVPDLRAVKLLFSLKDRSDDSIMLAITKELAGEGIKVVDTTDFSDIFMTPEGTLTSRGPTDEESADISFGWDMAREIGRLDIGQTVVVKDKAVMAVEAIEGTDEAIKRGGRLAQSGAVVVKVSKPQQDMRFDVPVVGLDTLHAMIEVKASVLAVEAGKSILLNREKMVSEADRAGIAIVGFKKPL